MNFRWTFIGNVVYAISQWAMVAVLAKLGSPEMVGQFALGLAVTAPIIILANLGLRPIQATDARHSHPFGHYLALRLVTTILALAFITLVVLIGYPDLEKWVILGIGLAKAIEAVSDVYYGLLQQNEQMDRIARSLLMKGPLSLIALGIGVVLTNNVLGGIIGLIVARLAVLFAYDIPSGRWIIKARSARGLSDTVGELRALWEWSALRRLAWLAAPLGVTAMFLSLNTNVPRYLLERYWSAHELGIFAALAYLFVAGSTVVSALGQSASPRLAKYYAAENVAAFRGLILRLLGIGLILGSVGVVIARFAGGPILSLLYEPAYANHIDILTWLALAATISFVASFLGYGITAARYFYIQPVIFGATTLLSLLLSFLLIPRYGMMGAAWTMLGSNSFQLIAVLLANLHAVQSLRQGRT